MNNLKAITLSFNDAPIDVRERVVLGEESAFRLLNLLKEIDGIQEALVLSTCNRTEIFYAADFDRSEDVRNSLKVILGDGVTESLSYFQALTDNGEVIKRLFEVSIGLHSQVVGDMQITNQVKKAYQWSADSGMAGPQLHRIMHTIFYANKRVVQETPFRDGAASLSYAAKELSERVAESLDKPVILVVGVGEIGRDYCGNISDTEARVVVANRTHSKAVQVAGEYGFNTIPYNEVKDFALENADIIVTSISRSTPLFGISDFSDKDLLRHKFFIDLSVPRSVDPKLGELEGVVVYTVDEIKSQADESLQKRLDARDRVKEIIEEEITGYNEWSRDMIVSPTIKKLKLALEQIREEEMERWLKNASGKEKKMVEKVTKSMMQKVIKLPVLNLKAACKRGEAETLIDVLNGLFSLEEREETKTGD